MVTAIYVYFPVPVSKGKADVPGGASQASRTARMPSRMRPAAHGSPGRGADSDPTHRQMQHSVDESPNHDAKLDP